ncbi:glycosyltransferase [Yoonia vestfoldensis]|uniref:Glycosyltransferase, group 1 n=1 Tax=Yoonia vestfoldensis SKA53 TaxID=314232 RepID=A3V698_9RHOB|nr:glycosyltransferase [Yoonia vestfoldensis]EAQ06422.1 glycosyltransferase, group 1 [Yoonia vestfoldensis SKA53]
MNRLVCIIGTDGSGKTTLSDALVERLQGRGERARRVWLGSESYLMAPVRAALKLVWDRRRGKGKSHGPKPGLASQRVDYAAEIAQKNALAARHPFAVRVYLAMVWFDYWLQLWIKRLGLRDAGTIVADRYLFDVAVNVGLALGWSPEEVVRYAQTQICRIPLPEVRVFLRVEPEVSMARKDDVFDIHYVRMRLHYYDAIAEAFGFTVRDGTLPIAENADWLADQVAAESTRPYVLYVHSNNVDVGGADKVLALMARHMRDQGRPAHGCRVAVALRLATPILDSHAEAGVPVFLFPFERPQTSRGIAGVARLILRTPGSLWFFWCLFGRERPDIVHVNDLYDFLPALAARLRGIPVVWHIRMIVQRDRLRRAFSSMISRLSGTSISVSRAVRDHYFPFAHTIHRALVIHDLGNAALIADDRDPAETCARPDDLPKGGRLVVMVGRIEPWKGQHVFLEAVEKLSPIRRADAVFALAGGPVQGKEEYHDQVSRRATSAGVLLLGERSDIPALLRSADISVHTSVSPDPFPGVVIESLLSGAATIAAAAGGAVEMIDDGVHGRLCPPGDSKALAAALSDLLDEPQSPRRRFGANARSRALMLVDSKVVDAAVMSVYSDIVARDRNNRRTHQNGRSA